MTQYFNEQEKASLRWKLVVGLFAFLLYECYLIAWQSVVKPFPDYMYLEFHSVFLNYLSLSQHIGNDLSELIGDSALKTYPHGFFLFPWLIRAVGLHETFIQNPWLITVFMTAPLAFLPLVMDWSRNRTLLYLFFVFMNPGTQIILKSWNIQSMIAIYTLMAVGVYISYLRRPKVYKIAIFLAFAWFSITLKHLGAFFFILFFLMLALWRFLRRESMLDEMILGLILANISIIFYPNDSLSYLIWVINSHNPYFEGPDFLVLIVMGLALGAFFLVVLRKRMGSKVLPAEIFKGWTLLLVLILWNSILLCDFDMFEGQIAGLAFLILALAIPIFLLLNFDLRCIDSLLLFLFLSTLGWGGALYFARIGHTSSIILFPLILFVFLWVIHLSVRKEALLVGSFFLLYTNFFPKQSFFTEYLGNRDVYDSLFHTQEQSPLGWSRSGIGGAREALIDTLELYKYTSRDYEDGLRTVSKDFLIPALGFSQNYIHHFPELEDELSDEEVESSYVAIKYAHDFENFTMLDDLWIKWIHEGRLQLLIFNEFDPQDQEPNTPQEQVRVEIEKIMKRGKLEHAEVIQLGDEICKVIIPYVGSKPFLMEQFWQHTFFFQGSRYFALVHKSIKRRRSPPKGLNYYLAEKLN